MKHKISELEGVWLDAAVAKAEGRMPWHGWVSPGQARTEPPLRGQFEEYSSDWRDGGPIIERENISVIWGGSDVWFAVKGTELGVSGSVRDEETGIISPITLALYGRSHKGKTSLIAAMRAYLASSYGDEVELP